MHAVAVLAGMLLMLLTVPGSAELALLTMSGILPTHRRGAPTHQFRAPIRRMAAVVPAHNEEIHIAATVSSLGSCAWPGNLTEFAIVVVADNCLDSTAAAARKAGARVIERSDDQRRGKGYALQYAFDRLIAEGFEAFVVIDADTVVEPNLLTAIIEPLDAGADGVQARYGVLNPEVSVRTRLMNIALMAFNVLRPRGRERLGLSVGILGNGFALTAATLTAVPYDAHSVVEDLEYGLRIVQSGRRIAFADATTVRGLMPASGPGVVTQRTRWEGGRFHMIAHHVPQLARGVVKGQTALIEPMLELMLLPLAFHVTLLLITAAIPFRPARLYALCALALVGLHIAAGIVVGGGGWRDFTALTAAPAYALWKLKTLPKIIRAAALDTPWMRTER
jgi:cellulose synthase/poly-beta-1,6-N-acetylglucosamine synthase-like glycosyltransferase